MSELENIESLTNKQLHQKCLQYGLPNVPVTDSSRKILLCRLQAAIEGSGGITNTMKNRRETIHATKSSGVSEVKYRPNQRRTIAAQSSRDTFVDPAAVKEHCTNVVPITTETRINTENVKGNYTMPETSQSSRNYRAGSLSKTGVLTTSYFQELSSLGQKGEMEDDSESVSDVIYNNNPNGFDKESYGYRRSFKPLNSARTSTEVPLYTLSKTNLGTTSYVQGQENDDKFLYLSSQATPGYTTFRKSGGDGYFKIPFAPFSSHMTASSAEPYCRTQASSGYSTLNSACNSTLPRYRPSLYPTLNEFYTGPENNDADNVEENDSVEEDEKEPVETPYLQKFSRNLEQLKAEQLSRNLYKPLRRRSIRPENDEVTFQQFWLTLDRKYHLKEAFYVVAVFLLAAFIYAFFVQ